MADTRRGLGSRTSTRGILYLFLLSLPLFAEAQRRGRRQPHIVVIMADDLGWSDVGYRDQEMATPNIDRMRAEGVELGNSYMQQVCTPSRAAFLSGYYPFRMGLQHSVFSALKNNSLPLGYTLLPQGLKNLGYNTHYVGKWHLGFCNYEMTPTYRGFDTFYGMYNGKGGYFDHISKWNGYDLHDNSGSGASRDFRVDWSGNGTYSTFLFTNRSVRIVENHDASQPLFLFLSYQAVHGPLEVPEHYVTQHCAHVTSGSAERKLHCAMTAAMDEGVGQVMAAMERTGLAVNAITLFISDNGGPVKIGSSNWPLRGSKITLWEGGTKVVSILHSRTYLPDAPYRWDGLMHAVDWYPTLMKAAGARERISGIDGKNNWWRIVGQRNSRRTDFVYNIDDVKDNAALRYMNYKLTYNSPGKPDSWYNPPSGLTVNITAPSGRYPQFMLFDLATDPAERNNIIDNRRMRSLVNRMKRKLNFYRRRLQPTREASKIQAGKPRRNGGAWVSGWC